MADGDISVVISTIGEVEPVEAKLKLSWPRHRYDEGDPWPISITVRNMAGTLVDPSEISAEFVAPSDTRIDADVPRASLGIYSAEQVLNEPGEWYVVVTVDGTYSQVEVGRVPAIPLPLGA